MGIEDQPLIVDRAAAPPTFAPSPYGAPPPSPYGAPPPAGYAPSPYGAPVPAGPGNHAPYGAPVHVHHSGSAPFRVEVNKKVYGYTACCGNEAAKHYFPEDYSIHLQNHVTPEEYHDIIKTSNEIVYDNIKHLTKYARIVIYSFLFVFFTFMISMVVGTTLVIVDPFSPISIYVFVIPSFVLFGFTFVMICVMIPLSISARRATAKAEDQIRHFFDKLNHERFMSRGVQLRVETTLNFAVVGNNARQTLQLRLVIEVVPRH